MANVLDAGAAGLSLLSIFFFYLGSRPGDLKQFAVAFTTFGFLVAIVFFEYLKTLTTMTNALDAIQMGFIAFMVLYLTLQMLNLLVASFRMLMKKDDMGWGSG